VTGSHLLAVNVLSARSLLASFGAIGVFLVMLVPLEIRRARRENADAP
jgi:hypothetical protein